MLKETVLLKQFILDAPASQSKHTEAISWLNAIVGEYNKQRKELKELKTQLKQCDCLKDGSE